VTEHFDADWLRLREPFDHAARSVALARRLAELLPARPRLLDLAAGTGSLFRFLAPIIGRGQDWILVDADTGLLDDAFGYTAAWARRHGFAATSSGDTLQVSTPRGLWRMQVSQRDLMPSAMCPSTVAADAVVCSALLDLVSAAWLGRQLDTLRVPLLACLTVDGRDAWKPHHPNDALVHAAFRRDQRRDKGFGSALGTDAPAVALALAARDFIALSAPTEWHVRGSALSMQRALIDGTAHAARTGSPRHARAIVDWQEARLRQALRGRLAIRIGHRDILALPRWSH
jgi:SAM-dependent methyltransferase